MVFSSFLSFAVILATVGSVQAGLNDWKKPCHTGTCFYDIEGDSSASLAIVCFCNPYPNNIN
jgi:hypothetical protein